MSLFSGVLWSPSCDVLFFPCCLLTSAWFLFHTKVALIWEKENKTIHLEPNSVPTFLFWSFYWQPFCNSGVNEDVQSIRCNSVAATAGSLAMNDLKTARFKIPSSCSWQHLSINARSLSEDLKNVTGVRKVKWNGKFGGNKNTFYLTNTSDFLV